MNDILSENRRRHEVIHSPFDPITGLGSIGERIRLDLPDYPLPVQYLPQEMMNIPLIKQLKRAGTLSAFITKELKEENTPEVRAKVIEAFVRLRCRHDFAFWAKLYVFIKPKGGGDDVRFMLNRPQRKLITTLEEMRRAGQPIRLILLKARQWGGSTAIQIYMAWLQLMHEVGLNSLIVGHQLSASTEVKSMFERMIKAYPVAMLYPQGEAHSESEAKIVGVGTEQNIKRIPQRKCNIKIGSAERPDSARGGDYNLVHCTEVGLWRKTEGKTPEEIVQSACSGILLKANTMIVYESTAKGTGNFFHREWEAARRGESQFAPLFVAWYEIEQYSLPFASKAEEQAFAERLYEGRNSEQAENKRSEAGKYLWWLWERGATLEAIHWYITERSKYNDHGAMASEYPSDDVEAFVHSGARVFDKYQVEALRRACTSPRWRGSLYARGREGKEALQDIRFTEEVGGAFCIWSKPEIDEDERITDRYLVVVDIGGRSTKSDYSVIAVFDRLFMMDGGKPSLVAQWYGHIDMDILAWQSAMIARYYDNALLVIESNTLETRDRERSVEGDQSGYILSQIKEVYDNLYARRQSEEEIREQAPKRYGFHTNTATKPMIISTLQKVLREGLYVERDERCLDEYLTYERKPNGSLGAISGRHDDLLMTRAIGLHICYNEMPLPRIIETKQRKAPRKSYAGLATM